MQRSEHLNKVCKSTFVLKAIVFPFRILALENNFLLQFQIDVSVIFNLFMCLIMQTTADLIGLTYSEHIHLRILSFFPKASSKDERRRDFDKIFAHYDVVSILQ